MPPSRDDAWKLLNEYTQTEGLIRHALAVEAAMRAYAERFGEDIEKWGIVGLLHDFDYERWPEPPDHPLQGSRILAERGYPDDVIYAIKSHAEYLEDCPRVSRMDKTLFAVDELCGMIMATALMRPSRSLDDLTAKSVKKKMKTKGFAAKIDRSHIEKGVAELGVDMTEHIDFVIKSLRPIGPQLGFERIGPTANG